LLVLKSLVREKKGYRGRTVGCVETQKGRERAREREEEEDTMRVQRIEGRKGKDARREILWGVLGGGNEGCRMKEEREEGKGMDNGQQENKRQTRKEEGKKRKDKVGLLEPI
jgi:hypothetical protein